VPALKHAHSNRDVKSLHQCPCMRGPVCTAASGQGCEGGRTRAPSPERAPSFFVGGALLQKLSPQENRDKNLGHRLPINVYCAAVH
jgi:hypothetical protein